MKYIYKYLVIKYDGKVIEFLENKPETTLDALGAEGWKLIGNEYVGKKFEIDTLRLCSSIWIAMKEVE